MIQFFKKSLKPEIIPVRSLRSLAGSPASTLTGSEQQAAKKIVLEPDTGRPRRGIRSVSQTDRIFFIDNLAVLLQAGMPLSLALSTLGLEARGKTMRSALRSVKHTVDSGGLLSDALRDHPEIFSPLFVSVVEVGEASGTLAEVLARLATSAKRSRSLRGKMINALIYPCVVIIAIIAVIIVLMLYVFPQLIAIFKEVDAELPIQTKIMIMVVEFTQAWGLYMLAGFVVVVAALIFGLRFRRVKRLYHKIFMRAPLAGRVWREIVLVRVIGNLQMLLASGVPIVRSLTISSRTAGNILYEEAMIAVAREVELGNQIHDALSKRPSLFPSLIVSMSKVGEDTGKFEEILGKMETFYEERVENVFANLSAIIEPVLLLSIGVVVGFVAVSVIMPIYNLAQAF